MIPEKEENTYKSIQINADKNSFVPFFQIISQPIN